jgi:hypothetical protein
MLPAWQVVFLVPEFARTRDTTHLIRHDENHRKRIHYVIYMHVSIDLICTILFCTPTSITTENTTEAKKNKKKRPKEHAERKEAQTRKM